MKSNPPHSIEREVTLLTSFVYFVQGALSLPAVAFPLFLRERGWEISEIATFSFVIGLPWTLKLFYGALSDGVPIGGEHRRPYILLASLLSMGSWLGIAFLPPKTFFLYLLAVVGNFGFAVTDVVTDALIVENSTQETTQVYQSFAWGFRSLGAIVGGVLGGWMAQNFPHSLVFGITAGLPLMTFVAGAGIHESPGAKGEGSRDLLSPILSSLRALFQGNLKWFSLLLLVGSFSSSLSTPFFFFLKEKLAFSETFLGFLSSLSWLGAILGCFLYARLFKGMSLKKTLLWSIGLNTVNILSTFGILDPFSGATLSFLGGILGYLSLLPLMAGAAFLSRQKGIEGSLFALLMSVHNLGTLLSIFLGGRLFDIMGLGSLILFSATAGVGGLFFVVRLKTLGR